MPQISETDERRMIMAKCTGIRCPMQVGYKVDECNHTDCPHRTEPQTNGDRIRAMSDEELAENLYRFCDLEERIGYCKNIPECEKLLETEDGIPEKKCIGCLLDWLKQPVEE